LEALKKNFGVMMFGTWKNSRPSQARSLLETSSLGGEKRFTENKPIEYFV